MTVSGLYRYYYRVKEIEEHPDFSTRSYHLTPKGLEDPDNHIVAVTLPPGDVPISLEDNNVVYTVQLWQAEQGVKDDVIVTVNLTEVIEHAT